MNRLRGGPGLAILAATILTLSSLLPAQAGAQALQGGRTISVDVSVSSQQPLTDLSETALAEAQQAGRSSIYALAQQECAVLKASIAETCQLTHINVSTQVQPPQYQSPALLYLNGSANFTIGLKANQVE